MRFSPVSKLNYLLSILASHVGFFKVKLIKSTGRKEEYSLVYIRVITHKLIFLYVFFYNDVLDFYFSFSNAH